MIVRYQERRSIYPSIRSTYANVYIITGQEIPFVLSKTVRTIFVPKLHAIVEQVPMLLSPRESHQRRHEDTA